MRQIQIELKNCFGIKELNWTLDYGGGKNTQVIYAPNGVMKTSLANVLRFISGQSGEEPKDRLHPQSIVTHIVLADGATMDKTNLFVADAEDVQTYDPNEAMSTLLASKRLKDEYEAICKSLDKEKTAKNDISALVKNSLVIVEGAGPSTKYKIVSRELPDFTR